MRCGAGIIKGGLLALLTALPVALALVFTSRDTSALGCAAALSSAIAIVGGVTLAISAERTLERLRRVAVAIAEGEPEDSAVIASGSRFREIADAFREMSLQLRSRIEELSQLGREQDAILRSMTEGVVTIDSEGRIRRVNDAALVLLGIQDVVSEGVAFGEVLGHPELRRFIVEATAASAPRSGTVVLREDPEVILDVYGSPLFQDDGTSSGTLIVFRDMTRVHKLENVRRDFVANVSHELRTPITSIKGFTETLLDGAMNEPEDLKKFLGIIAKHAERLHAIFNDLHHRLPIERKAEA